MKITCANLEIHVSHTCNLACDNCSHFSNYGHSGNITPDIVEQWSAPWLDRLQPEYLSLLGGEPTINPQLIEIIYTTRACWASSKIQLVTNGWFLHRFPDLPAALEKYDIRLEVSIHHDGERYNTKVAEIHKLLNAWQQSHKFYLNVRNSTNHWRRVYKLSGKDMKPLMDNDQKAAWAICPGRTCKQLFEGKLWKCPPVAYIRMMHTKYGIDTEAWKSWLEYKPLDPGCTDQELIEWVNRQDEVVCNLCPSTFQRLRLKSPIRGAQ